MFNFKDLQEMKLFTYFYIDGHENLTTEGKEILYNFTKTASQRQIEHLLLKGEMVEESECLAEYTGGAGIFVSGGASTAQTIFNNTNKEVAAAALVALAVTVAYKIYRDYLSKAAQACGKGKSGALKKKCMAEFKKKARRAKIASMQKSMSKCSKTKNPEVCKNKLQSKIAAEKAKMGE